MESDLLVEFEGLADQADSALAWGARTLDIDGDLRRAGEYFETAYRLGERAGNAVVMAEAALGAAGWWLGEQRTAAASGLLRARLRHVVSLLNPSGNLALRVRVRLAAEEAYRSGGYGGALALLDEVRRRHDPLLRAEAVRLVHHTLLGPDHGPLRRVLADELVGEAGRGGGRGHLLMGLLLQTTDMFLDGDRHAHRRLAELRTELGRGEHLAVGYVARAVEVMLTIRAGRLADAERLARECYEWGVAAGDVDAAAWHAAHLGAIRWYQGRVGELEPVLKEMVNAPDLSPVDNSFMAAYAVAAAAGGDHQTAMQAMASLLCPTLADLPRSGSWLVAMYCFVEAAYLIGNEAAAARAYELLCPYRDQPMMASLAVACFGSTEHALGVAALTTGDLDRAVDHLHRAVRRNLALGHRPAVLYSRLRLAEALERRRADGDQAAAAAERLHAAALAAGFQRDTAGPGRARTRSARAACTRHGRRWRVELGGRVAQVQHRVGMLHLAVLLANPGDEILAFDLVAGVEGLARRTDQPVLDRATAQRYRERLAELPEAAGERSWLLAELGANTRPGGRLRMFADDTERARLAVGRAIRRAISDIEHVDQVIGAHLRGCVHTGVRCWYRPI